MFEDIKKCIVISTMDCVHFVADRLQDFVLRGHDAVILVHGELHRVIFE